MSDSPGISGISTSFDSRVVSYYSRKTEEILYKYGPGPQVHFHVGLFSSDRQPTTTVTSRVIRARIAASQQAALEHAADSWGLRSDPPARMLDIGCGLGGGSLYWAEQFGCYVTGLTVVAEHVPIVAEFARQAGVADQVAAVLGDVHDLRDVKRYDAAVAIESSGYMDRKRLFQVAAAALRPGGWFGLQEHFVCRPEWTDFVDGYYKTQLGTVSEYLAAAHAAGFELERDEDFTDQVVEFWVQSMAWAMAEVATRAPSPISRDRLRESALTHGVFFRLWRDHALETRQLLFRLGARQR